MIVHNFETTVTVPQHTVVVPKPACSYQNYTTFQRYFQGFSQFCVFGFFAFPHFLCVWIFMWYRAHSSERPGPGASAGAFALPRCAPQGGCDEGLDDGLMGVLMDWLEWWISSDFWRDWSCFDVLIALIISYLWCSLLFICSVTTLPVLSPAVLLLKFHRM